jgi:hypothetical protein
MDKAMTSKTCLRFDRAFRKSLDLLDQNVDGRFGQNAKEAKEPTDQNGDREEFRMASSPRQKPSSWATGRKPKLTADKKITKAKISINQDQRESQQPVSSSSERKANCRSRRKPPKARPQS